MADRIPVFELHILPMFRQLDRQHMLRVNGALDLWNYDSVKANAPDIIARAGAATPSMPTSDVGGFWPTEWRAVFARWAASGFRRLSLGLGRDYKLVSSGGNRLTLSCTVSIPNAPAGDSTAWFDIVQLSPATYRLHVFPGEADPPAQDSIDIQVEESVPGGTASVAVLDQSGSHNVAVAGS
jgi:hypothetical protein